MYGSMAEILECAVVQQMEFHLHSACLLPPHQSAYRKDHSTETALVKVCADLIRDMDRGHHAVIALLDLSAAFDTVDHAILLERLSRSFGIHDSVLQWLQSYVTGRVYSVRFGGCESARQPPVWCSAGLGVGPTPVHSVYVRPWPYCR